MTDYTKGDEVEVTMRAEVVEPIDEDGDIYVKFSGGDEYIYLNPEADDVTVKLIDKPFVPGDIVKYVGMRGDYPGGHFTVMNDGVLFSHSRNTAIPYSHPIDSKRFVKVASVND